MLGRLELSTVSRKEPAMTETVLVDTRLFSLVVLPLLIFLARIADVTIGTMRIIFVSRGFRLTAACAGFLEVFIWLLAIGQIMTNLANWINYFAYAGGFAVGNYIGITIEHRLALGFLVVRIITQRDGTALDANLRDANFVVTSVDAEGGRGPVKILFTVVKRRMLPQVLELIKTTNPMAYFTIEDLRSVSSPGPVPLRKSRIFSIPGIKKGK